MLAPPPGQLSTQRRRSRPGYRSRLVPPVEVTVADIAPLRVRLCWPAGSEPSETPAGFEWCALRETRGFCIWLRPVGTLVLGSSTGKFGRGTVQWCARQAACGPCLRKSRKRAAEARKEAAAAEQKPA